MTCIFITFPLANYSHGPFAKDDLFFLTQLKIKYNKFSLVYSDWHTSTLANFILRSEIRFNRYYCKYHFMLNHISYIKSLIGHKALPCRSSQKLFNRNNIKEILSCVLIGWQFWQYSVYYVSTKFQINWSISCKLIIFFLLFLWSFFCSKLIKIDINKFKLKLLDFFSLVKMTKKSLKGPCSRPFFYQFSAQGQSSS